MLESILHDTFSAIVNNYM